MLKDEIAARVRRAMKEGNTVEKEVLRVALGEIQTAEARAGAAAASDAEAEAVVRRLIKSNEETALATSEAAARSTLTQEIAVLRSLLPQTLDAEQIRAALTPVADAIKAAGNDGQATGIAMKALKQQDAAVTGKDVSEAVRKLRTGE